MAKSKPPVSLGVQPSLKKKSLGHTGLNSDGTMAFRFVMSEEDKVKDNYKSLKELIYYYEWIGRQQVTRQRDKIAKKFNLAYGKIDVEDYVKDQSEYDFELSMLDSQPLDFDLKFYALVPNIVNRLVSQLSKQYINYSAVAVNREAANKVLEEKNQMIREMLIAPIKAIYEAEAGDDPDLYEQSMQMMQQLPEVQKYMAKEYRLEIEKWANHQMAIDKKRFRMDDLEKSSFFNKLTTDLPFVHINLMDGDYKPEVLDPRYTFYLRSPYTDDISEAVMFGWFEYESPKNIITRFGDKLTEADIEKLENLHLHYRAMLTIDSKARYNLDTPGILESAQNHLAFAEIARPTYKDEFYRGEEYKEKLVEVSNMYIQVPRKMGKLTMRSTQEMVVIIVDETYKESNAQSEYDFTYIKEKTAENLIQGEHIEWFYINELWRCVKINLSTNPNPDYSDDIFIMLEKYPIQLAPLGKKYGSYIPVHGGPKTNRYGDIISLVDKCKPWQVFFNYLWNRIDQLMQTEVGKFLAINQNVLPQESMGESWGPHNIAKWLMTARDTKIAPIDNSITNTGQNNMAVTGGYGQMLDLTVTDEVIQKAKLAEICRNECLMQVGVSPQLLGEIGPSETATGVTQGIQNSIIQLKYLYDEHFAMFEKVRQTMLECARFLAIKNDLVEQVYMNDEGERVVFQIPSDILLHQMGVFVTSDLNENVIIENIKMLAIQDNTMGASILDKVNILSAKSVGEVYGKLKEQAVIREAKEKEAMQMQQEQQQQMIEAQERMKEAELQAKAREKELDREHEARIQEMKVIGQAQFSEGGGLEELEKLRAEQLRDRNKYMESVAKAQASSQKSSMEQSKFDAEKEKIRLERERVLERLKRSENDVKIARINPT